MSALHVLVRGQVLDLLLELQEEMGLAYLFISHDMAVIERMSHDVAVMRGGQLRQYEPGDRCSRARLRTIPKSLMPAVPVLIPRRGTSALEPALQQI